MLLCNQLVNHYQHSRFSWQRHKLIRVAKSYLHDEFSTFVNKCRISDQDVKEAFEHPINQKTRIKR